MFIGVALITLMLPTSIHQNQQMTIFYQPYIVQAVIDSARIIGLPSSRASRAHALKIQSPDPILEQIIISSDPVSDRKLFFRNYFK